MSSPVHTRRGFAPLRDLPAALWLIALIASTAMHPVISAPRWLMIHLLLLGALSHSILVWSRFFAEAVLHHRGVEGRRDGQNARLGLLNLGVVLVVTGVLGARWPVTVVGATAVAGAVLWHAAALVTALRRALPARFAVTVWYYIAAASLLPLGVTLGVLLARDPADPWHAKLIIAHAAINLFGWVGLTVGGTLVTLWPTMLRTQVAPGVEQAARRALPVMICAVLLSAGSSLLGWRLPTGLFLLGYLAGFGLLTPSLLREARVKPPSGFATWSVLAGLLWGLAGTALLGLGIATAPSWVAAGDRFSQVTPFLAAGFAAQVLLGALSYLIPTALGGGPTPVRAATAVLDRAAALRITMVNAALVVCALPSPSIVRVLCSSLALAGLVWFVVLLFGALRASRRAKAIPAADRAAAGRVPVIARPRGQLTSHAVAGLAIVALAVAGGVAADPSALVSTRTTASVAAGVAATGETTTVAVSAKDMRFFPDTITVPAGNRLVIELTNTDDAQVHDLVLDSGQTSGRLAPGASATLDLGVVGRDLDGWCSIVGHRARGMVLTVVAQGAPARSDAPLAASSDQHDPQQMSGQQMSGHQMSGSDDGVGAAADIDPGATPGPGFTAPRAALTPLTDERVHTLTMTVTEQVREVAPGVTQKMWSYNGTSPGPVLHGRVGDVFDITLVNDGSIGHSIDFHAGSLAPDRPMRTIPPGESLRYRFTATRAGAWLYHCSSMPMSAHIANGMFGAVVIEPRDLAPVDRSYLLVSSELYLGAQGDVVDVNKVNAERPDLVVFNGYANAYDAAPLEAKVGERVRIWVLDAGPNRPLPFHVIGSQFDTVYQEGAYLLRRGQGDGGSQVLGLSVAQGGFVELSFPETGHYPFVSHLMIDAERGAHGHFDVSDSG